MNDKKGQEEEHTAQGDMLVNKSEPHFNGGQGGLDRDAVAWAQKARERRKSAGGPNSGEQLWRGGEIAGNTAKVRTWAGWDPKGSERNEKIKKAP